MFVLLTGADARAWAPAGRTRSTCLHLEILKVAIYGLITPVSKSRSHGYHVISIFTGILVTVIHQICFINGILVTVIYQICFIKPQERRPTGICPGNPSLQHLWPVNHRLQKVCICWRSSNHARWWWLAGCARGAEQGHGNRSWIPPDLKAIAQHYKNGVDSLPS